MSRLETVSAWEQTVSSRLPGLSGPQARVLALWSYGMVLAQRCGQTSVAAALALLLGQKEGTVRQRLREWCREAAHKRGHGRRTVEVEACFAPLLGWVLSWWAPGERRLALALDATTLGERFSVLALCVVYRGCAVPVAWTVVRATRPGAWRPHWERLLRHLQGSVPASWVVVVLADRGLYAPWLFAAIVRLGWHPGLRVNGGAGSGLYRLGSIAWALSPGLYRLPSGGQWWTVVDSGGQWWTLAPARRAAVRPRQRLVRRGLLFGASRRCAARCWPAGRGATARAGWC